MFLEMQNKLMGFGLENFENTQKSKWYYQFIGVII